MLLLQGCWGSRELKDMSFVVGFGVDAMAGSPGMVQMTAQIVNPERLKGSSGNEQGGEGAKAYWNLHSEGDTVFDAIRGFTHETHNKLYTAHNEILIFGKEAAQGGVQQYLDFFLRAQETRPTLDIAVTGARASEVLDVAPHIDKLPAVNAAMLVEEQGHTSQSMHVTLLEFTNSLISKTGSALAPMVHITDDNGSRTILVEGLAVFKKDRMVGELNADETRGALWVLGQVQSGIVKMPSADGITSVEIKKATRTITPAYAEGKLTMDIRIQEEGIIVSQTGTENAATADAVPALEEKQAAVIRDEIQSALEKARALNADFLGFGTVAAKSGIPGWEDLESRWDEVFPSIEVNLSVRCKIRAAGNLVKPAVAE